MLPRLSIRHILLGMVAIALLSLCMSSAWRGNRVAVGVSVAAIGMVIPFCGYFVVHWVAFLLALIPAMVSGQSTPLDGVLPSDVPSSVEPEIKNELAGTHDDS